MKIGLLSDTHGYLAGKIFHLFADVDQILHAGDVGEDRILDELEEIAPVIAVSGNMDSPPTKRRPQIYAGILGGVKICMTHGHLLDPSKYNQSALCLFAQEQPRIIIHGHSHRAKNENYKGVTLINPGAACKARFHDVPSVAVLEITTPDQFVCTFCEL